MSEFESTVASLLLDPLLASVPVVDGKKVLPPVELVSRLGEGAMGAVYRGVHQELKIEVAVKCLKPALVSQGDQFEARFRREANLAARLSHQNLVRLYELRSAHELTYLVLEFVDGETIDERVKRKGPHSPEDAAKIMLAAARGLSEAHRHPEVIIHRDFKPANLLISKRGQVKVADLGLAKALETTGNASIETTGLVGTPKYMAPEQWETGTDLSPRTDVWAMGATLYYLLTGQAAMQGNSISQIAYEVVNEDFPDASLVQDDLPEGLLRILERCTEKVPSDRYADAVELAKDLQAFLRESKRKPVEIAPPPPLWHQPKVRFGAAAALILIVVFAWGPFSGSGTEAGFSRNASYSMSGDGSPPTLFEIHELTGAKVPLNWEVVDGTPGAGGWATLVREPKTKLEFRLIPNGTFLMGSPEDEEHRGDDETQHEVELTNSFYMAVTELAIRHIALIDGRDPATFKNPDFPAVTQTWQEAYDSANFIGCSLPTEAQWEHAARGTTTSSYWWGDDPADGSGKCNVNPVNMGYNDDIDESTAIASFSASPNGLWDMTGNVWEWCMDGYDGDYPGHRRVNPSIRHTSALRIVRGGSWSSGLDESRVANRMPQRAATMSDQIGFRPILELFEENDAE